VLVLAVNVSARRVAVPWLRMPPPKPVPAAPPLAWSFVNAQLLAVRVAPGSLRMPPP
jgi:hypothetical protein